MEDHGFGADVFVADETGRGLGLDPGASRVGAARPADGRSRHNHRWHSLRAFVAHYLELNGKLNVTFTHDAL